MILKELQTALVLISEYTDTIESGFDGELCFIASLPIDVSQLLRDLGWQHVKLPSDKAQVWYKNVHNT